MWRQLSIVEIEMMKLRHCGVDDVSRVEMRK